MKIIITDGFFRDLKRLSKKYHSLQNDVDKLGDGLAENPFQGVFIGRSCYKIRLAISSKGRGKSGGGRVITCVKVVHDTVFLLTIYDKSERESLKDNELDELLRDAGLEPDE